MLAPQSAALVVVISRVDRFVVSLLTPLATGIRVIRCGTIYSVTKVQHYIQRDQVQHYIQRDQVQHYVHRD